MTASEPEAHRVLAAVSPDAVRDALGAVEPLDHGSHPTCTADVLVAAAEVYARVLAAEVPTPSAAANVLWARELAGRPDDRASRMAWAVRAMDVRGWTWEHLVPTTTESLAGPSPRANGSRSWIRALPVAPARVERCLERGFLVVLDLPLTAEMAGAPSDGRLTGCDRATGSLRHVVLAHALAADGRRPARIRFRNSWGTAWGADGDGSFPVTSPWRAGVRDAWVVAPSARPAPSDGYVREQRRMEVVP